MCMIGTKHMLLKKPLLEKHGQSMMICIEYDDIPSYANQYDGSVNYHGVMTRMIINTDKALNHLVLHIDGNNRSVLKLFVCWGFTCGRHLRSHQDGHQRLYSPPSKGDQAANNMTQFPTQLLSWYQANQSLAYPNNAQHQSRQ